MIGIVTREVAEARLAWWKQRDERESNELTRLLVAAWTNYMNMTYPGWNGVTGDESEVEG